MDLNFAFLRSINLDLENAHKCWMKSTLLIFQNVFLSFKYAIDELVFIKQLLFTESYLGNGQVFCAHVELIRVNYFVKLRTLNYVEHFYFIVWTFERGRAVWFHSMNNGTHNLVLWEEWRIYPLSFKSHGTLWSVPPSTSLGLGKNVFQSDLQLHLN